MSCIAGILGQIYIANRDWNKTCKEISTILDGLEYFSVEYNSNTSAGHPL